MSDVARTAGVSTMTVSNVINGRPRVGEQTKQRVLTVIADLGYQVNLAARHLRAGRTGVIGLAVAELERPYYAQLAARLADRFAEHGLRIVVERTGGGREGELEAVAFSRLRMYDGLVLSVIGADVSDLDQIATDAAVVLIGEKPAPAKFDHVLMDNVGGARQATAFLLGSGARRIVLLGGERSQKKHMTALRSKGYLQAHAKAGVEVDDQLIVDCHLGIEHGHQAVSELLARSVKFDAIFALTDSAALGGLRALADAGLRVPEEVQVIGFDDIAESRYSVPSLTTVDPDNDAMADAICELLLARLNSREETYAAREVMPRARIIHRESTKPVV